MKKFLVLPLLLAVGFAILVLLNTDTSGNSEDTSDFVTTPSGLKYKDLMVGTGKEVKPNDTVVVHYTGWLRDGTKFDSSYDHGMTPYETPLDRVVKGWQEGIPGMKVGGKRRLIIPPELGYGKEGSPPTIPPNATLTFEVELVDVRPG
jgi:FKBP-type peptidyl-prolyl cis-trans isomerase